MNSGFDFFVEAVELLVMLDEQDANACDAEQEDDDGQGQKDPFQGEGSFQVHCLSLWGWLRYA